MIARYTRPELGALWTDQAKMDAWRDVEVAAAEGLDGPTEADLEAIRGATFTVEAVQEREGLPTTTSPRSSTCWPPPPGRPGAGSTSGSTSSDVLDTALALQLRSRGRADPRGRPRLRRGARGAGA